MSEGEKRSKTERWREGGRGRGSKIERDLEGGKERKEVRERWSEGVRGRRRKRERVLEAWGRCITSSWLSPVAGR